MTYLKAFVLGIVIPATLMQLAVIVEAIFGWPPIKESTFFHQLPIIWAVWNVAYFAYFKSIWPKSQTISYLIHGALLGVIVVLPAVFYFAIPEALGFKESERYIPLGLVPVIYSLIWVFGVRPLNRAFGL